MARFGWVLVWAVTMALGSAVAAYAADAPLRPLPEAALDQQPQVAPPLGDTLAAIPVETRPTGLKLNIGTTAEPRRPEALHDVPPVAATAPRAEDLRSGSATSTASAFARGQDSLYQLPGNTAGGTGLKLSPAASAAKPGWEVSGRVGPVRFLSPLDGEGGTKLRFGGRLPGQPRMPGMGLFNVGIHYNFE